MAGQPFPSHVQISVSFEMNANYQSDIATGQKQEVRHTYINGHMAKLLTGCPR